MSELTEVKGSFDALNQGFTGLVDSLENLRRAENETRSSFAEMNGHVRRMGEQTVQNLKTLDCQVVRQQGELGELRAKIGFLDTKVNYVSDRVSVLEGEVRRQHARQNNTKEGTLAVVLERLQKLEDRLAEKDEEIAILRGQVLVCFWLD